MSDDMTFQEKADALVDNIHDLASRYIQWEGCLTIDEYRGEVASIIRGEQNDPDLADMVGAMADETIIDRFQNMSPHSAAQAFAEEAQNYTTCMGCGRMNIPIVDNGAPSLCEHCQDEAGDIIEHHKEDARRLRTALSNLVFAYALSADGGEGIDWPTLLDKAKNALGGGRVGTM